jgi:predicted nucleic acid-binding protein
LTTIVVDASVGVKWFLPSGREPFAEDAAQLLHAYVRSQVNFLVPDIFWAEIANAAWKAARRGELSAANTTPAVSSITALRIPSISSSELLPHALAIALAFKQTVYDGLYVALAVTSSTHLITADERLADSLAARFPVKWLGGYHW